MKKLLIIIVIGLISCQVKEKNETNVLSDLTLSSVDHQNTKVKIEGYKGFILGKTTISSLLTNGYKISKPKPTKEIWDNVNWTMNYANEFHNCSNCKLLCFMGKYNSYEQYQISIDILLTFKNDILVLINILDPEINTNDALKIKYGEPKTTYDKVTHNYTDEWCDGNNSVKFMSLHSGSTGDIYTFLTYYSSFNYDADRIISEGLMKMDASNISKNL